MENTNSIEEYGHYTLDHMKHKEVHKAETIYYIKQKLLGLLMTAIGIIIPLVCDGDATASLIVCPLGLYLIFTKEKVITL